MNPARLATDPATRERVSREFAAAAEAALRAGLAALRLEDARERERLLGFANLTADSLLDAAQEALEP